MEDSDLSIDDGSESGDGDGEDDTLVSVHDQDAEAGATEIPALELEDAPAAGGGDEEEEYGGSDDERSSDALASDALTALKKRAIDANDLDALETAIKEREVHTPTHTH